MISFYKCWWDAADRAGLGRWASRFTGLPRAIVLTLDDLDDLSSKERALVDLVIPSRLVFAKHISAPRSARRRLRDVARLDLSRSLPLSLDDVYFAHDVVAEGGDRLEARIDVVRRGDVEAWRDQLSQRGWLLRRVWIDLGDASPRSLVYDDTKAILDRSRVWLTVNTLLAASALALSGYLAFAPVIQHQTELEATIAEADALEISAFELRRALEEETRRLDTETALANEFQNRESVLRSLTELTVTLPDTVWLTEFHYEPEQLRLSGFSREPAAQVMLMLQQSGWFAGARLSGPISFDAITSSERFDAVLDLGARQ